MVSCDIRDTFYTIVDAYIGSWVYWQVFTGPVCCNLCHFLRISDKYFVTEFYWWFCILNLKWKIYHMYSECLLDCWSIDTTGNEIICEKHFRFNVFTTPDTSPGENNIYYSMLKCSWALWLRCTLWQQSRIIMTTINNHTSWNVIILISYRHDIF